MIETIAFVLTGIGLTASIVYYANVLNNANKTRELQLKAQELAIETRQAQLFMGIYQSWILKDNLKDMEKWLAWEWTDFDDFMTRYGPEENPEDHASWDRMIYYFEGIGLMVKQGLVNPDTVFELLGLVTLFLWDKYHPLLLQMRENVGVPTVWQNQEEIFWSGFKTIVRLCVQ